MGCLGNILWLIFGGFETALMYFGYGVVLCCTIIGIPWGIQLIKLGLLCLWPFGTHIKESSDTCGCFDLFFSAIFLVFGGIFICITHLLSGILLYITIIGIPWGHMHFRLARLALSPFGKELTR